MNKNKEIDAIKKAKKIVEDLKLDEPFKSITYKTLLDKFLSKGGFETPIEVTETKKTPTKLSPLEKLSKNLKIPLEKVNNIVQIENGSVIITKELTGKSRTESQTKGIVSASYVFKLGFNQSKMNSEILTEVCRNSGIDTTHIENAFTALNKKKFLVGVKKGSKLKILTPKGVEQAKNILME